MRFVAVLNKDGGTLRTTNLEALSERMKTTLESAGHTIDIRIVEGKGVVAALEKAAAMRSVDVLLAGGGDGTISAAASLLMNRKMALAILPAGTMNLFARGLGIPQSLDGALEGFADSEVRAVDIASANGRPFVHQFSIGLHAKMVHLRDKMEFASRLGKIGASLKAAYRTVMNPPSMKVQMKLDDVEMTARASGIGVSNNLFGEGHLPYADKPDGGTLGVYVTVARQRADMLRLAVNMARGRWSNNQQIELHKAQRVVLKLPRSNKHIKCVVDGELCALEAQTTIEIHPGALKVLVPRARSKAKAA
jgi:YegS/Rv2252/BmrU family lipid kinase